MSETTETTSQPPVMTMEQKAQILLHQRQSLTLQITIERLNKQLSSMPSQLQELMGKVCAELGIKGEDYILDLDSLTLSPKVPEQSKD